MKNKSVVFVSAALVATVIGSFAAGHAAAENKPFTPIVAGPVGVQKAPVVSLPRIPVDLGPKKVSVFNKALANGGLPPLQLAPPPAFIRLTPAAPTGAGGSKILAVGNSVYYASDSEKPDGAFLVDAARPNVPSFAGFGGFGNLPHFPDPNGQIDLSFMTEATKQYIADCRFTPMDGLFPDTPRAITFSRSTSTTPHDITQDDGHYLYAFRAEQTATIKMSMVVPSASAPHFFYGCEITKTN